MPAKEIVLKAFFDGLIKLHKMMCFFRPYWGTLKDWFEVIIGFYTNSLE